MILWTSPPVADVAACVANVVPQTCPEPQNVAPGEDPDRIVDADIVIWTLDTAPSQASVGFPGVAEPGEQFGRALAHATPQRFDEETGTDKTLESRWHRRQPRQHRLGREVRTRLAASLARPTLNKAPHSRPAQLIKCRHSGCRNRRSRSRCSVRRAPCGTTGRRRSAGHRW